MENTEKPIQNLRNMNVERKMKMKKYELEVESIHPREYKALFYEIFNKEKAKGNLSYRKVVKEIAPPPELVRDFVIFSAATLTIIKHLYDFYKETRSKKGKVYITVRGKRLDLEVYNIDELKAKIITEEKDTN